MSKKLLIPAIVAALVLAGWLCYYFSDKMVIRRQFVELAQDLAKAEQEQPIQMALKMGRVKTMLATTCQATVPEKGYAEELEQGLALQYLIYYRSRYSRLTVQLEELQITLPATGQAVVQVRARLQRHLPGQADSPMESHRVELTLLKGDQRWLIQKAILPVSLINENILP
jgi:hypothetical protein